MTSKWHSVGMFDTRSLLCKKYNKMKHDGGFNNLFKDKLKNRSIMEKVAGQKIIFIDDPAKEEVLFFADDKLNYNLFFLLRTRTDRCLYNGEMCEIIFDMFLELFHNENGCLEKVSAVADILLKNENGDTERKEGLNSVKLTDDNFEYIADELDFKIA